MIPLRQLSAGFGEGVLKVVGVLAVGNVAGHFACEAD